MRDAARTAESIRRIEQAAGRVATLSVARMDDDLPWFRKLPPDQRSWVSLVAQAGVQSFVEWLRSPDQILRLTGDVFASAPRELVRSVTLQQTVELVRKTIAVTEEQLPSIAATEAEAEAVRVELLRFSREIAFAAARVYAGAAESRGSWDTRLEALVIDGLVRGEEGPLSQVAALGWRATGPVSAVVGSAPDRPVRETLLDIHRIGRRLGVDVMVSEIGPSLVVIVGGAPDPLAFANDLLGFFGAGPVVASHAVPDLSRASAATRAALSGLRAAPAWPGAPRPVSADALLPERALAGDAIARDQLVTDVYEPLAAGGEIMLDTVSAYFESGGALESTARALFVHANTVRYRLRRAAELCGEVPTQTRGAFTLQVAIVLGRLETLP